MQPQSSDQKQPVGNGAPPVSTKPRRITVAEVEDLPQFLDQGAGVESSGLPDNPMTPAMVSPTEAQIMNAIINIDLECLRSWMKPVLPEALWKVVEACGEATDDLPPHIKLTLAACVLLCINMERKVAGNKSEILTKAEGAESTHFRNFCEASGVEFQK